MMPELLKGTFFILILTAVALEAFADVLFKKWAGTHQMGLLIAGLAIYFAGTIAWAFSLKYEYLSRAISVFTILNFVIVVLVGIFVFKEDLSFVNKIGIALGVVSLILIEI